MQGSKCHSASSSPGGFRKCYLQSTKLRAERRPAPPRGQDEDPGCPPLGSVGLDPAWDPYPWGNALGSCCSAHPVAFFHFIFTPAPCSQGSPPACQGWRTKQRFSSPAWRAPRGSRELCRRQSLCLAPPCCGRQTNSPGAVMSSPVPPPRRAAQLFRRAPELPGKHLQVFPNELATAPKSEVWEQGAPGPALTRRHRTGAR